MKNSKCSLDTIFLFKFTLKRPMKLNRRQLKRYARVPSSQALKCGEEFGPLMRKSLASEVSIDTPHPRFFT